MTKRSVTRRLAIACGLGLLFAQAAFGQTKPHRENDGLKGPVYTVMTESVTFSNEGDVWVEGQRNTVSFTVYDKGGTDARRQSSGQSAISASEVKSRYDDKGREIEQVYESPDGKIIVKRVFKYDDKGRKTEETDYENDGSQMRRAVFTYDSYGNTSSMSFYDERDRLTRRLTWTFDAKGNRTEWTESTLRGEELALFCKITSSYDGEGNILEEIQYGNPEGSVTRQTFRYEFDAMGNWVKRDREWHAIEGGPRSAHLTHKITDYRTISYYPAQ
ncbi:MAG TPA: hypothetical protein VF791_21550 [Pyrinomonadaceae bacterium]